MEKHNGIVLRKYAPYGNKLIILDRKLGKIIATAHNAAYAPGAIIKYGVQQRHNHCAIEQIELVALPLVLAKHDILFLHHILEVCYYCVPLGSIVHDMVDYIMMLYDLPPDVPLVIKKALLFKLYLMMGLQVPEMQEDRILFSRLATESVDSIAEKVLHLGIEEKLSAWLQSCIAVHPHARYFKTMHFFTLERSTEL